MFISVLGQSPSHYSNISALSWAAAGSFTTKHNQEKQPQATKWTQFSHWATSVQGHSAMCMTPKWMRREDGSESCLVQSADKRKGFPFFQAILGFFVALLTILECFQDSRLVIWSRVWYNKYISYASIVHILKENKILKVKLRVFPEAKTAESGRRAQSCGDVDVFRFSIIRCPILCHKYRGPLGWMWKEPHYNPSLRYSWKVALYSESKSIHHQRGVQKSQSSLLHLGNRKIGRRGD